MDATVPTRWAIEVERNHTGRKFYFVSRFVSARGVEYVEDSISGEAKCFRLCHEAEYARDYANRITYAEAA